MAPEDLAVMHARAFARLRPWSAQEFSDLLGNPLVFLCTAPHAFALGRGVADEAELLTIATDPDHQGKGYGAACLRAFETEARQRGAERIFLEVDSVNAPALGLYRGAGFETCARRKGYYRFSDGQRADAIVMAKRLLP
jgi:ribosomal-protein-alanine N-acetyltransferase